MSSELGLLIDVAHNTFAVKCVYVCSWTVLLWDTIICFPDELKYIWHERWSSGKILYLVIRYVAYADTIIFVIYYFNPSLTPSDCFSLNKSGTYILLFCFTLSEASLLMRTYAIWGLSRVVLAWLGFSYLSLFVASLVRLNNFLGHDALEYAPSPYPSTLPCFAVRDEGKYFETYSLLMTFDLNLFIFTAWRAFFQWRKGSGRLVHIVFRDGTLYFASLAVISILNVVFFAGFRDKSYFLILMEPHRIFHVIFPLHLTLNIRKAARQQMLGDSEFSITTPTLLRFQSPTANHISMSVLDGTTTTQMSRNVQSNEAI